MISMTTRRTLTGLLCVYLEDRRGVCMRQRIVIGACVVASLLAGPVAAPAQLPTGIQIPGGFSKDALLQQAKDLVAELLSMKDSGKLPPAQTKQVDELLPRAQSLTTELAKPQVETSRLPQLATNLTDLQKHVASLKSFMK